MKCLYLVLMALLIALGVGKVHAQSDIPTLSVQPNGDLIARVSGRSPACGIPAVTGLVVPSQPFTLLFSIVIPTCQSLPPVSEWVDWTREVNYGQLANGRYLMRCIRGYGGFLPVQYAEFYLNLVAGQLVPDGHVSVPALSLPGWLALISGCSGFAGWALHRRRRKPLAASK